MYVFCFFLFLVSNTGEGWKAGGGLWLGDANLVIILFYFLHRHTDTCRMST